MQVFVATFWLPLEGCFAKRNLLAVSYWRACDVAEDLVASNGWELESVRLAD